MSDTVLAQDELRDLLRAFKATHSEEYDLRALGYFGSYARNEASGSSDVDIVFETGSPNLFKTAMLRQDLEAALGRPVGILRLQGLMNPRLKARIEREAVYV